MIRKEALKFQGASFFRGYFKAFNGVVEAKRKEYTMAGMFKSGTLQGIEFKMQHYNEAIDEDIDAVDALLKDAGLPKKTRKKIRERMEHSTCIGLDAGHLCGEHGLYVPEVPLEFEKFMPWVKLRGFELNR